MPATAVPLRSRWLLRSGLLALSLLLAGARVGLGGEPVVLRGAGGWVGAVAYAPGGQTLATGASDASVQLWDSATRRLTRTLSGHEDAVCALAFHPAGGTLASGSFDQTVRLWDPATGQQRAVLRGHRGGVLALAFTPDGKTLATGSIDGTVRLWDTGTGKQRGVLRGHRSWVNGLAFARAGQDSAPLLATASSDGTVKLWDLQRQEPRLTLPVRSGEVRCVALSPDGRWVAAGIRYGTVQVWEASGGRLAATLKGHTGDAWAVAFTADGRTLVSGGGDWKQPGQVRLWEVGSWRQRAVLSHTGEVLCLAIAPADRSLAAGSWDRTVQVWDLPPLLRPDR